MRCHFGTHGTRIELHELQDEPPHNFTTITPRAFAIAS
jgi:hypothetical protein